MPQPGEPGSDQAMPPEEVDPEELEEAKQVLLKAGLTEQDLSELQDYEIVELAEKYQNGTLDEEEEEESPPGNSPTPNSG